jgi:hypothetical protein
MLYIRIKSNTWNVTDFFKWSIVDIVDYTCLNKDKYPFLSSIDYYGVTYFSHQQVIERIIPELLEVSQSNQFTDKIERIVNYLEQLDYHNFLQIVWD